VQVRERNAEVVEKTGRAEVVVERKKALVAAAVAHLLLLPPDRATMIK
jgi:hypothetical protein